MLINTSVVGQDRPRQTCLDERMLIPNIHNDAELTLLDSECVAYVSVQLQPSYIQLFHVCSLKCLSFKGATFYGPVDKQRDRALDVINSSLQELT